MKSARAWHASFNLGNKLYVVGGKFSFENWIDSCEVYDILDGPWSEGPSLPYAICFPKAMTNHTQSFSLVLGTKVGAFYELKIIIFDETSHRYCCAKQQNTIVR